MSKPGSLYVSLTLARRMGDYHRYLAEFATGDKRKDSADKSLEAYKGCIRRCRYRAAPDAPHPSRTRPQLLRLLVSCKLPWMARTDASQLRDPQQPRPSLPPRQAGIRRRHCRARHTVRGVLQVSGARIAQSEPADTHTQGLYSHHATPSGQLDPLDLGHD